MEPMLSQLERLFHPDQLIASDSTRTLSAAALFPRARALAAEFIERGIRVLALQADNSTDWLLVDLAAQEANVCLVPIPGFFSSQQVRHVLEMAPVDAFIGDRPADIQLLMGDSVTQSGLTRIAALPLLRLEPKAQASALPPDTGKITFTSGSTGQPKGVCLSNEQLYRQATALGEAVGLLRPRHLCLLPLSTLLENIAGLYAPLLQGGEVVIPGLAEIGFSGSSELDPHKFTSTIRHYLPETLILTPQLLLLLVSAAQAGWQAPDSLRFVAVGGGRVSPGLLQKARDLGIPAFEGYGLSECASVVSLNTPSQQRTGSCGKVLPHLDVRTEGGEIIVKGNAMLGYLGEPASWGQQEIHTGDLGSVDADGFVSIAGRSKNLLISSFGRNINPEWVESELLAQPLLSECVVLGDDRPYCIALVTPRQASEPDAMIQKHIDRTNQALPDYARIRRWIRLPAPLQANPQLLTPNGRPRRGEIAQAYASEIESLYPFQNYLETA